MSDFKFKFFSICHNLCGMKVGTDGVLLGAWAALPQKGRILDIGTGTGLLALMAAQRVPQAKIVGIDIDEKAVAQAKKNVDNSIFSNRIQILHCSVQEFKVSNEEHFDAIICNPPFFKETLLPPNQQRSIARHTNTLPFEELIQTVAKLLNENGTFHVVLPTQVADDFRQLCFASHLWLQNILWVKTTPQKEPKRVLMSFLLQKNNITTTPLQSNTIVLMVNNQRSAEYTTLTQDFYLW